ncbi:MAG: nucleotidyl transferase AbiEii/AbiGii toxin family protein [Candidatus Moraniibacteriota bacterium]
MEEIAPEKLHLDTMPDAAKKAFVKCMGFPWLRDSRWYLAGGTALALQVGHRISVDLDFFTEEKDFSVGEVERLMLASGNWTTTLIEQGTLYGIFEGAKMSFIAYPFFHPSTNRFRCGSITLLSPEDIAAMKIVAVSQRGRKRDFIDLYWLVEHRLPLEEALRAAIERYPEQHHSLPHFLKSLVYFSDAESDPMPHMFFSVDWKVVKLFFQKEIPMLADKMLHLEH